MGRSKGALWSKWDLHVHTPASLFHNYSSVDGDIWEKFIGELESLPTEFKVIGVNDYLFIDGYKRLREEKAHGRLKNIERLFPVIEFRVDKFGGTNSYLSRVNFHVVFSDQILPEIIEQQFLNALPNKYQISPQYDYLKQQWNALATRDSLIDLGNLIISSVPAEKRDQFGSPLLEGFNNINFQLKDIFERLESHYFTGKYITAVGKTEWANIKWNDQSIAEKKNIINSVDFVFISAESIEACMKAKAHLSDSSVNDRLLDCSDAHAFSSSPEKDKLGKCFTWIKAEPTFEGLKQVLNEPEDRVFIGDKPPKLLQLEENKTKFIQSLEVVKDPESQLQEQWFNFNLELNPDLVAIIGNKGNGKSALADILGLLGHSRSRPFAFLNNERFCEPRNRKASNFYGKLNWHSGQLTQKCLQEEVSAHEVEMVKYIPQHFLERICNETGSKNDSEFDKELKKVIFSHVLDENRLGQESLDSLIEFKTSETKETIDLLKRDLSSLNRQIISLEDAGSTEHKLIIDEQHKAKVEELNSHEKSKPLEVAQPQNDPVKKQELITLTEILTENRESKEKLVKQKELLEEEIKNLNKTEALIDKIIIKVDNFRKQYKLFEADCIQELSTLNIKIDNLIKLEINLEELEKLKNRVLDKRQKITSALDPASENNLVFNIGIIDKEIAALQEKMDEPNKKYQQYVEDCKRWEQKRLEIIGSDDKIGSIKYLANKIKSLTEIPDKLNVLKDLRKNKVIEIHGEIMKLVDSYKDLYKPVQQFIDNHPIVRNKFQLNFEVSVVDIGFTENFLALINQGARGSFYGVEDGKKRVIQILSNHRFDQSNSVIDFVEQIIENLSTDQRDVKKQRVKIDDQLRKGVSRQELYDYIFSLTYMAPKYELKLGNKSLQQLSPGEKGTLLLMFYFLVDQSDIPLIIDQPEENLDNQSVYELLVPCIKAAKKKRQIILVTHNPNLAVVCDAEQIICAFLDKRNGNVVTYDSGAIENLEINKKLVDILEGTRPAFNNREAKYSLTNTH